MLRLHLMGALLGLCLLANLAVAQKLDVLAARAPANTCLALAADEVAALCADFQGTRLGESLCGPDYRPLIEELRRRDLPGPMHLRPSFGFDWSELSVTTAPGGLFVFPLVDGQLGSAWLFAAATSGDRPVCLVAAERYFSERKFSRSASNRGGLELITFKPPANSQDQQPRVLFVGKEIYGVANSPQAAELLLSVAADKSLATDAAWQQAKSGALGPAAANAGSARPGDAVFLLRPMPLWELVRKQQQRDQMQGVAGAPPAEPGPEEKSAKKRDQFATARNLGFDGVEAVAGRMTFPQDGPRDWLLQANLIVPKPHGKALRLLSLETGPAPKLPEWASDAVNSLWSWRWDFGPGMQGFGSLFDEANEPGPDGIGMFEDMLDGLRDDPEGVQVDLRRDVFAHLGPEIMSIADRAGTRTEKLPQGDRTLYRTAVRDLATVTAALDKFYQGDENVKHERLGGYHLWTVGEGASLFVEGESDSVVSVRALALGEGQMFFGTDVELLKASLAKPESATSTPVDDGWRRLWNLITEERPAAALWAISRLNETLGLAYEAAISGKESEQDPPASGLWRMLLFGTTKIDDKLPYTAAPPVARARLGLAPTGLTLTETVDGWMLNGGALGRRETP